MSKQTLLRSISLKEESSRCLLCYEPPCSKACPNKAEPDVFLQAVRFENVEGAKKSVWDNGITMKCLEEKCQEPYCEKVCIRGKLDRPIAIKKIHEYLLNER